jgi:AraC-like DNA-binding protein
MKKTIPIQELWHDYKTEILFLFVLSACVAVSYWLSQFIPVYFMENVLTPIQHGASTAVCWVGAWLLLRHSEGMRIRKAWAYALLAWGIAEVSFLLQSYVWDMPVFRFGTNALSAYKMLAGNFLGWLLLVYPTETLRPGWLNWKNAAIQLLPMIILVVFDYLTPFDLRWLISLYPVLLFALVLTHLRAYKVWCEDNYSSMERIDVQWIVRYLLMLLVVGTSYLYMMLSDSPTRAFTQNVLLFFVFAYSTEQILFRKNPWSDAQSDAVADEAYLASQSSYSASGIDQTCEDGQSNYVRILEQWMATEKPYLNPDFRLMDLQKVLPMNRTYLSHLIHSEYDCTFYQFVNRYRIKEAKRLMREHPDMKMADVAKQAGFSSLSIFSQIFSKKTGLSPREWSKKN